MAQKDNTAPTGALFGQDAWINYLASKPFPVRPACLQKFRHLIQQDNTTIRQLGAQVRSDPILCLQVTLAAEKRHAAKGSHVTSIDHAVSSMGIEPLEALAKELLPFKFNPASVYQKQYLQAIANSHHAAVQARAWAQLKHLSSCEEIYLSSLFYSVGMWALWLHAPLHMHKIQCLIWEQQTGPVQAEEQVLGCSMQQISLGLSRIWGLSQLTQEGQDQETSPSKVLLNRLHQRALSSSDLSKTELRELSLLTQERHFPIKLSNWLAMTANRNWKSTRTVQMIDMVSDYLELEITETTALLHQLCAQAAREYHIPGTLAPAARMLQIPSNTLENYKLGTKELALLAERYPKPEQPPAPAPAPVIPEAPVPQPEPVQTSGYLPDTFTDAAVFRQITERFVKGYSLYTKPSHILQGLMQGLYEGLGLPRVVLNIVHQTQQRLKAAQSFGFTAPSPLTDSDIDLNTSSLLSQLAEKPGSVWIHPNNQTQYQPQLPPELQTSLPHSCLLSSLFRDDTPVAIIYADSGEQGPALQAFHQEHFKYLCSAATLALKRL